MNRYRNRSVTEASEAGIAMELIAGEVGVLIGDAEYMVDAAAPRGVR